MFSRLYQLISYIWCMWIVDVWRKNEINVKRWTREFSKNKKMRRKKIYKNNKRSEQEVNQNVKRRKRREKTRKPTTKQDITGNKTKELRKNADREWDGESKTEWKKQKTLTKFYFRLMLLAAINVCRAAIATNITTGVHVVSSFVVVLCVLFML